MSHLCRSGKCLHLTPRLCYCQGLSGWSPGLQWRPNNPCSPWFIKFCRKDSHYIRDPYYKLCCKCHEREVNRCLDDTLGNSRVAHILLVWRAVATMEDDQAREESGLHGYDEVVITKNMETVDAFSSHVIPVKAEKAYMGEYINVMIQALQTEDGSLLQGLAMQNVYSKLRKGRKNAIVVVRNSTAYPQTLKKKAPVARAVGTRHPFSPLGYTTQASKYKSWQTSNWQICLHGMLLGIPSVMALKWPSFGRGTLWMSPLKCTKA